MEHRASNKWLKHWDFIILDLFMLQLAYFFSCLLWQGRINPYQNQQDINISIIISLAGICSAFILEGYHGIMRRSVLQEFKAAVQYVIFIAVVELAYLFLSKRAYESSRAGFVLFVIISVLLVFGVRCIWKQFLLKNKVLYKKKAVLILTSQRRAGKVLTTVLQNTYNELEIMGVVLMDSDALVGQELEIEVRDPHRGKRHQGKTVTKRVKVVCTCEDIPDYIQTRWVDEILVSAERGTALPDDILLTCIQMGVTFNEGITVVGEKQNQQIDTLGGYVVVARTLRIASHGQLFVKRLMDIAGGLVGILFTGILTIFLGPAIYLSSPGPIFFSQIRVGKNGRRFRIYKFRSMYMDAEERKKELMERNEMQGLMFKMEADPRIIGSGPDGTRHGIGWFIRKTSLDEFPQFWNILKGDMSLVGTRPPTVDEWEHYEHHHRGRLAVKSGLTGMWQVSGRSDITDFEEVVRLDMEYIQNWSIWLDIKILLKTVWVVFAGRGSR